MCTLLLLVHSSILENNCRDRSVLLTSFQNWGQLTSLSGMISLPCRMSVWRSNTRHTRLLLRCRYSMTTASSPSTAPSLLLKVRNDLKDAMKARDSSRYVVNSPHRCDFLKGGPLTPKFKQIRRPSGFNIRRHECCQDNEPYHYKCPDVEDNTKARQEF